MGRRQGEEGCKKMSGGVTGELAKEDQKKGRGQIERGERQVEQPSGKTGKAGVPGPAAGHRGQQVLGRPRSGEAGLCGKPQTRSGAAGQGSHAGARAQRTRGLLPVVWG